MIYASLHSHELKRFASKMIAVLPLAAIEQHGPHLPVITDTAIADELGRRVEAKLPKLIALLPTLWCGSSHHHKGFSGTLSLRSETYVNVLIDIIECLIDSGFQRIFLLNCHGGNQTPFTEALYRLNLRSSGPREPWITAASYWNLAARELGKQTFMETPLLSHACEYETSMMLALKFSNIRPRPQMPENTANINSKYYDQLNYTPSRIVVCKSYDQLSENGALGSPEKATAEKGNQLFDLITPVIVDFLKDFSKWKYLRPKK